MNVEKKKSFYPIIVSFLLMILSIGLVYAFSKTLQNYETEITLPKNQTLYLHPDYVTQDIQFTQLTDKIVVYETTPMEQYKIPLAKKSFTTSFFFNPNVLYQKDCGILQGDMKIVFDQVQCKCIYGLCPEIQELKIKMKTLTEKFDQPYIADQQQFDFQVRKNQLIGQNEFEASTLFFTFSDVQMEIQPQLNNTDYMQQCELQLNYTIIYRDFANISAKQELAANITEAQPYNLKNKHLVIQAFPDESDFVLLQIKTNKPQKVKLDGVQQFASIILLTLIHFIYSIINYLYCDIDKIELFE